MWWSERCTVHLGMPAGVHTEAHSASVRRVRSCVGNMLLVLPVPVLMQHHRIMPRGVGVWSSCEVCLSWWLVTHKD